MNQVFTPSQEDRPYHARKLWEIGRDLLRAGKTSLALDILNESLAVFDTAEGFTYRACATAIQGDLVRAVRDCRRALRLDPGYGPAYNDLGLYFFQLGRHDEALVWFAQALDAERMEHLHSPHLNMAQIFLIRGETDKALYHFVRALDYDPENQAAREGLASLEFH